MEEQLKSIFADTTIANPQSATNILNEFTRFEIINVYVTANNYGFTVLNSVR